MSQLLDNLDSVLKITRLVSSMTSEQGAQVINDAVDMMKVIAVAPYGCTCAQIASITFNDEKYTQAILNLLVKGGMLEEGVQQGLKLYRLKG